MEKLVRKVNNYVRYSNMEYFRITALYVFPSNFPFGFGKTAFLIGIIKPTYLLKSAAHSAPENRIRNMLKLLPLAFIVFGKSVYYLNCCSL